MLSRIATENGLYDQVVAVLKKYDITPADSSKTRFQHPSKLFHTYVSLYDNTFTVYFGGRDVVKRAQYISYHYDPIDYNKLEARIKRLMKKVAEKSVLIENRKQSNREINEKLINYLDACHVEYEVINPYSMGAMKVKIGNEEYYVNNKGTVQVNLAGKRMHMPVHNMALLMDQACQFSVDQYEDVAAKYQTEEEVE